MSLPIYQRVAVTDAGDVIPGAEYTVINENTGVAAPIYSDRTGATLLTAPYFADSAGTIQFFIAQGTTFRVAASGGVGTYTDRYVYGVAEAVLVDASGNANVNGILTADGLTVQSQANNEDAVSFSRTTSTDTFGIRGDNAGVVEWRAGGSYGGGGVRMAGGSATSDGNRGGVSFHAGTGSGGLQSERLRIDSAGNLLVGTTDYILASSTSNTGAALYPTGTIGVATSSGTSAYFNRLSTDGTIIDLRKNGTTVGIFGTLASALSIGSGDTGLFFQAAYDRILPFNPGSNAGRDNAIDLGEAGTRFKDVYITNGVAGTSDRNEKQDILKITAAETAVAKVCKGLLRSFRWKDAVVEKGDDARIHFGIIAQDLQDAFAAEGLDAGRYGMFMSNTWWETQTEVAAVEAVDEVTDEDGNVTTEAVEAKGAYTRTDTFQTLAEAPAGATERTRLGVRYSELLAFIIAAI